jgi:hypothetical protein
MRNQLVDPYLPFPQHNAQMFRLSFDMQIHIHDVCVSLFVLMCVYLTSAHASVLLDRSN